MFKIQFLDGIGQKILRFSGEYFFSKKIFLIHVRNFYITRELDGILLYQAGYPSPDLVQTSLFFVVSLLVFSLRHLRRE